MLEVYLCVGEFCVSSKSPYNFGFLSGFLVLPAVLPMTYAHILLVYVYTKAEGEVAVYILLPSPYLANNIAVQSFHKLN